MLVQDAASELQGGVTTESRVEQVPKPITPGVEMEVLARFFRDVSWTGTIVEHGMGHGSPEMTASGSGAHELIQDGCWIVGTYEQDQFLHDGTFVLKWQLHWVVGWDPADGEYRAILADNYGHADVMRGWIEGDRLTFETLGERPVRLQLIWDASDPNDLRWRNEMSVAGAPFTLVEEYHCAPVTTGM
jgi:hypothetical protein